MPLGIYPRWFFSKVGLLLALSFSALGGTLYFYSQPPQSQAFLEKVREVELLKLLGKKPVFWRSLMDCRFKLVENVSCKPILFVWQETNTSLTFFTHNQIIKKPAKACFVCHVNQKNQVVLWKTATPQYNTHALGFLVCLFFMLVSWFGFMQLIRKAKKRRASCWHLLFFTQNTTTNEMRSFLRPLQKKVKTTFAPKIHAMFVHWALDPSEIQKGAIGEKLLTRYLQTEHTQRILKNAVLLKEETMQNLWLYLGLFSAKIPPGSLLSDENLPMFFKKPKKLLWKKSNQQHTFFLYELYEYELYAKETKNAHEA